MDQAIAQEYDIPLKEQQAFSQMALTKFQNKEIKDTITRNVRDVSRKLGEKERILAPIRIIQKQGGNPFSFYLVCAAALWYGNLTKTYAQDDLYQILSKEEAAKILALYDGLASGKSLRELWQEEPYENLYR